MRRIIRWFRTILFHCIHFLSIFWLIFLHILANSIYPKDSDLHILSTGLYEPDFVLEIDKIPALREGVFSTCSGSTCLTAGGGGGGGVGWGVDSCKMRIRSEPPLQLLAWTEKYSCRKASQRPLAACLPLGPSNS